MNAVIGVASTVCLFVNMTFWSSLLLLVGIARITIPIEPWRKTCTAYTIFIGESCIALNYLWIKLLHRPTFEIQGLKNIDKSSWYVATSNHQSWADILVLQAVTNRKIPLIRFFMKDTLKWIPIVWIVGWALDMPFLKRYSEEKIKKKPFIERKRYRKDEKKPLKDFLQILEPFLVLQRVPVLLKKKGNYKIPPLINYLYQKQGELVSHFLPCLIFLIS